MSIVPVDDRKWNDCSARPAMTTHDWPFAEERRETLLVLVEDGAEIF